MVKRRTTDPKRPPEPDPAYAPAVKQAAQALTTRVQEMHTAISDTAFSAIRAVPGLSAPAGLVQRAHDAIAGGVYAAVRGGTAATMRVAAEAEHVFHDAGRPPAGHELALRSALNAAAGDALAEARSPLAVGMSLRAQGLVLDEHTAPEVWAGLRPRVALFIHGLACDEESWRLFADAWHGIAPGEDGQADVLSRLRHMSIDAFDAALARLEETAVPAPRGAVPTPAQAFRTAPASSDDPRAFLMRVMNDSTVPLALRIDAAKALLRAAP